MKQPPSKKDQVILYWLGKAKGSTVKQRIRIYKRGGEYEYFDISKRLTAFYDKSISLQYVWCLTMGGQIC